jgi:hypothetical protein
MFLGSLHFLFLLPLWRSPKPEFQFLKTGPVTHGFTGKNLRFQHVVFYPTKFGSGIPITEFIYIYPSATHLQDLRGIHVDPRPPGKLG